MEQYFKAVNLDLKEFVCSRCLGGSAKLWEWAVSPQGGVFPLLLRQSDQIGDDDFHGGTAELDPSYLVGRWAGDRVVLIGDADSSKLIQELVEYRNISLEFSRTWYWFIELEDPHDWFCSDCRKGSL